MFGRSVRLNWGLGQRATAGNKKTKTKKHLDENDKYREHAQEFADAITLTSDSMQLYSDAFILVSSPVITHVGWRT